MIKKHFLWVLCAILLFSMTIISWRPVTNDQNQSVAVKAPPTAKELFSQYVATIYQTANLQQAGLDINVFQKAVTGFINLKLSKKISAESSVVTVVDLSKSSCTKRMWIVDLISKHLVLNTWVAHGEGSGDDTASNFSDSNDSHQSSLGFYLTDNVYMGKHGRSLRLDGLDEGFNASARARAIVLHAANYVGQASINKLGRLGHSFGCPAVAPEVRDRVINTIKGKNVLFINGNDYTYTSKYLDEASLANFTLDGSVMPMMASK